MGALKDIYSAAFYNKLSQALTQSLPDFNKAEFQALILTDQFLQMELKKRMRHTTLVLHQFMPARYPDAVDVIFRIITALRQQGQNNDALAYIFLPDYLEVYGLDDLETSIKAMEFVTQFISCEFGIRSFIIRYPEQMMSQLFKWSLHKSASVRRLASEGSRPRLPWAIAIPKLKDDPSPLLPILENLKNDPSEIVRRSVANNLNDISKDNPAVTIQIAKAWAGKTKETDAIIKHACRTLLKQGHSEMMSHYGLDTVGLVIEDFKISTPEVAIGAALGFSFRIRNTTDLPKMVRLEYGLYYYKANKTLSRKVFKISERIYPAGDCVFIERKQSFKLITTRVFYPGPHELSLIVNGVEHKHNSQKFNVIPS